MRIAQIAPVMLPVPPGRYGGTERVVHYITEELVRRGHEVTLFATADSVTAASLVPTAPRGLIGEDHPEPMIIQYMLLVEELRGREDDFDIIHNHIDFFPSVFAPRRVPMVSTIHCPVPPGRFPMTEELREANLVAISHMQRAALAQELRWRAVIYHGLPLDLYQPRDEPGDYLVFLGRMHPTKDVDTAIDVAQALGMKLKIAGSPRGHIEVEYFERLKRRFDHPLVEYLGEADDRQKQEILGRARAFVFPAAWDEPFGLVVIESLACGTPVIATPRGAIPELIEHGVNGFLCETPEQMMEAVRKVGDIRRGDCRRSFEQRFSLETMVDQYVKLYEDVLAEAAMTERRAGALKYDIS